MSEKLNELLYHISEARNIVLFESIDELERDAQVAIEASLRRLEVKLKKAQEQTHD